MTSRTERLAHDLASTRELNEKEVVRLGSLIENKVVKKNKFDIIFKAFTLVLL